MLKKILSISMVIAMVMAIFAVPVSAETIDPTSGLYNASDIVYIWETLRDEGKMYNNNGHIAVMPNALQAHASYPDFVEIIEFTNNSIDQGIAYICNDAPLLVATHSDAEIQAMLDSLSRQVSQTDEPMQDNATYAYQAANAEDLDLIGLCEDNYDFIVTYYDGCMVIQMANPTTYSAWAATVTCWVTRVMPGGNWDYKVRDGYKDKTFNVEYNGKTDTITAEFLGNFNYGYTGSFLFGINALINGSTAVAGSIEKDQHDWPAIKEGYKAKTGENVI